MAGRIACLLGWHSLERSTQRVEDGAYPGTERTTYRCSRCGRRTRATEGQERKMGVRQ